VHGNALLGLGGVFANGSEGVGGKVNVVARRLPVSKVGHNVRRPAETVNAKAHILLLNSQKVGEVL
jgi:hypothetical protein